MTEFSLDTATNVAIVAQKQPKTLVNDKIEFEVKIHARLTSRRRGFARKVEFCFLVEELKEPIYIYITLRAYIAPFRIHDIYEI